MRRSRRAPPPVERRPSNHASRRKSSRRRSRDQAQPGADRARAAPGRGAGARPRSRASPGKCRAPSRGQSASPGVISMPTAHDQSVHPAQHRVAVPEGTFGPGVRRIQVENCCRPESRPRPAAGEASGLPVTTTRRNGHHPLRSLSAATATARCLVVHPKMYPRRRDEPPKAGCLGPYNRPRCQRPAQTKPVDSLVLLVGLAAAAAAGHAAQMTVEITGGRIPANIDRRRSFMTEGTRRRTLRRSCAPT